MVSCDELVFDLSTFYGDHPGGQKILLPFYGNDITRGTLFSHLCLARSHNAAFNGAVYNHSNGARNLARHYVIARLENATTI